MGRKVKVTEEDLIDYLGTEDRAFPNAEIGDYFAVCKPTIQKACKNARGNGHPIIPTGEGQWLIKRINTPEQLIAVQNAIGWASDLQLGARKLGLLAGKVRDTATKKITREAEDMASGE